MLRKDFTVAHGSCVAALYLMSSGLGWDLFNRTVTWKKRNIAPGVNGVEYITPTFIYLLCLLLDPVYSVH